MICCSNTLKYLCCCCCCVVKPFRDCWKYIDLQFTYLSLRIEATVQDRNLMSIPETVWTMFCYSIYFNFILALFTFVCGTLCFTLGLYYSTFYTRINCENGLNIWIPLNNIIATGTGFFAIKALHVRWSAFVHIVFTATMTPLMLIAAIFATMQVPVWYEEQRMSRGGKDWGYWNADANILISFLSYTIVCLSVFELIVYYKYWVPQSRYTRIRY